MKPVYVSINWDYEPSRLTTMTLSKAKTFLSTGEYENLLDGEIIEISLPRSIQKEIGIWCDGITLCLQAYKFFAE